MSVTGDEIRGYGSDADPLTFSDAEAVVLRYQEYSGVAPKEKVRAWRAEYRAQLPHITRLEQVASCNSAVQVHLQSPTEEVCCMPLVDCGLPS